MPSDDFVALLDGAGVEMLIDVRSVPASRRNPQFARTSIEDSLKTAGIGYRWDPRLGGFRRPQEGSRNVALRHRSFRAYADYMAAPEFKAALESLLDEAARRTTTVMCAETLWWRCHRRLIADAATLLGSAEVQHLGHDGRLGPHRLTEGVRVDDERRVVYDGGLGAGASSGRDEDAG
jgi:uncharacterized protein (DUF488 family)